MLLADGSRYSLKHHPLHSPTGFEWGYGGSGPADLSFAILADHLGDLKEANEIHQSFKWQVVSLLPESLWVLHDYEVQEAIEAIRRENA